MKKIIDNVFTNVIIILNITIQYIVSQCGTEGYFEKIQNFKPVT